jgi:hypothetical protein
VLAVVLFAGFIRFRLLEMPLERDEGEYAYAGQLILQGIPPYELACNLKLPGTYYAYAVGMAIFGQTVSGIHLTLIVVNSLIIVFVFLLGRKLFGDEAGLVAGASYAAMSVSPAVLGLAAHANFFVILFALPATLLLWQAIKSNSKITLFFAALLYGLAFVMKQQGIWFGVFGGLAYLFSQFVESRLKKSSTSRNQIFAGMAQGALIFSLAAILPFAITCLYLESTGVFSKFWFWTFTYAREYVTAPSLSYGEDILTNHLDAASEQSLGLWLMAVAGVALGLCDRAFKRQTLFAISFWLFSFAATATGLYFRRHYFILVLPAFAILVGLAAVSAREFLNSKIKPLPARLFPLLLFAALLGWNIYCQAEILFKLSPDRACQQIYQENPFVEAPVVAKYIRAHASPGARLAVVGSEPEIYFYTKLHSATSYLYATDLMQAHPYATQMQREMINEIETNRPEYIVFVSYENSWCVQAGANQGIFDWFDKYMADFYDKVGLVETLPNGDLLALWDNDAKISDSAIEHHHLEVYRRKS